MLYSICDCDCISYSVVSDSLPPHRLYSLPGFSIHRILQARILEWIAISFSRGTSQPRDWTLGSCLAGRFFTVWTTEKSTIYILVTYFVFNSLYLFLSYSYAVPPSFPSSPVTISFLCICESASLLVYSVVFLLLLLLLFDPTYKWYHTVLVFLCLRRDWVLSEVREFGRVWRGPPGQDLAAVSGINRQP